MAKVYPCAYCSWVFFTHQAWAMHNGIVHFEVTVQKTLKAAA